ncbi:uncharacterized protein SCHCODRAFT_02642866 [Schizophyllum commune H4-8]|uniref:uncharacterized protein n=1 Tax=Schizophyllum commune (strain H4-8 / FGSC 9210) TaxID=578458 RepID=UPI0021610140|nr:uncharacterized protein SCHCODRAFT_02642866 [Schizophyllum commune H4-8]KAI5885939.1 hypothetical protein SCHCODRAFT_02642866 [Schizophyllum commune H4-8]
MAKTPQYKDYPFAHCADLRRPNLGRLKGLARQDPEYEQVLRFFMTGWLHPHKPIPDVLDIYKLPQPSRSVAAYERYRDRVASELRNPRDPSFANETLLFHGTRHTMSGTSLCDRFSCYSCGVVRASFKRDRCEADDYFDDGGSDPGVRTLLVSKVVMGRPLELRYSDPSISEPPPGHHSVVGLPGGNLNYPETVVYHEDAIRPAYIIKYRYDTATANAQAIPPDTCACAAEVPWEKQVDSLDMLKSFIRGVDDVLRSAPIPVQLRLSSQDELAPKRIARTLIEEDQPVHRRASASRSTTVVRDNPAAKSTGGKESSLLSLIFGPWQRGPSQETSTAEARTTDSDSDSDDDNEEDMSALISQFAFLS